MKKKKFIPSTKGMTFKKIGTPTKPLQRIIVIAVDYKDYLEYINSMYGFNQLRYPVFVPKDADTRSFNLIESTERAKESTHFNDIYAHCFQLLRKQKDSVCKCRKAYDIQEDDTCANCNKYYNFNRRDLPAKKDK